MNERRGFLYKKGMHLNGLTPMLFDFMRKFSGWLEFVVDLRFLRNEKVSQVWEPLDRVD